MANKPSRPRGPVGLQHEREPALRGQRRKKADLAQPQLPLDPMPARIEPCLALLSAKTPEGAEWAYEIKWDGYRLAIHVELGGRVRILTRGGHDWTHRFPGVAAAALALGPATMILDGEAVLLDDRGRSDFNALVRSLGGRGGKLASWETIFYAFDILYLDGHDLSRMSFEDRRAVLDPMLEGLQGTVRLSEMIDNDGAALLANACDLGLEGIIAKRLGSPYKPGRGGDWRKIKCVRSDTFVVVGYEPSTAMAGAVGSLLLAARKGDNIQYVGSVGTGFKHAEARDLKQRLDAIRVNRPAVKVKGKSLVFVDPILAAEIEYRAWTEDGKLRHPSFKGLRDEHDHVEVFTF